MMTNKNRFPRIKNKKTRETIHGYLFLLPSFVILGVFVFWPIAYSFVLSFFKWDFANQKNPYFNGFDNYKKLFEMDMALPYSFWKALIFSAAYIVVALCILKVFQTFLAARGHFENRAYDHFRKNQLLHFSFCGMIFAFTLIISSFELTWLLLIPISAGLIYYLLLKRALPINEESGLWTGLFIIISV